MEEVVVERGMDIVGRVPSDGSEIALGQSHADPLIGPEALAIESEGAEGEGQEKDGA